MSMPESAYQVGKGRPPEHTRFKKGQSGNPTGRKKVRKMHAGEAAARALERPITVVVQDGTKTKMTGIDALIRKIYAKATSGDMRAAELILRLAATDNARQQNDQTSEHGNEALIERFYERYARRRMTAPGHDDE